MLISSVISSENACSVGKHKFTWLLEYSRQVWEGIVMRGPRGAFVKIDCNRSRLKWPSFDHPHGYNVIFLGNIEVLIVNIIGAYDRL